MDAGFDDVGIAGKGWLERWHLSNSLLNNCLFCETMKSGLMRVGRTGESGERDITKLVVAAMALKAYPCFDSAEYMTDDFPCAVHRIVHDTGNAPMPHSHNFIELVFVEGGTARHLFEDESYELSAGDVFIVNPGEVHTFQLQPGSQLQIINCLFQPRLIHDSILRDLALSDSTKYSYIHPLLDSKERFHHFLRLRRDEIDRVRPVLETMILESRERTMGYQTLVRMRMIELLMLVSRFYQAMRSPTTVTAIPHRREVAQHIQGYLERHYQQKISLETVAATFHISTRQLNRLFRQELGTTVVQKVHDIRIERAKTLLTQTDEKVIAIATMVGYEDATFFSRLFTRQVGCSPGRFRIAASGAQASAVYTATDIRMGVLDTD